MKRTKCCLHQDLCTFMTLSRWFLLTVRNVSESVVYTKTYVHLWQCLADFFLQWEMFQRRVVEKIKTHFMNSNFIFRNLFFENHIVFEVMLKNIVEPDGSQKTIDKAHAHCVLNNSGYKHTLSECVILIAFPLQQCFYERAWMLL
jgi:hypothetical protein